MLLATATKPVLICSVMVMEKKIPQVLFSCLKMKEKGLPKWMEFSPIDVTPGLAKQNAISCVCRNCGHAWQDRHKDTAALHGQGTASVTPGLKPAPVWITVTAQHAFSSQLLQ